MKKLRWERDVSSITSRSYGAIPIGKMSRSINISLLTERNGVASLIHQLRRQHCPAQARQGRANLQDPMRVFRDPDDLLVGFIISGDQFYLVSVKRSRRNRHAFYAHNFQLAGLGLLLLHVEVKVPCAVVCR